MASSAITRICLLNKAAVDFRMEQYSTAGLNLLFIALLMA